MTRRHHLLKRFSFFILLNMATSAFAQQPLNQCVALRGNGNWIGAHFGALARIVEDYKSVDAIAGGSSSTVTALLYESMLQHPSVRGASDVEGRAQYLSLMLKSVYGYLDAGQTVTAQRFRDLQGLRDPAHWRSLSVVDHDVELKKWMEKLADVESKFNLSGLLNPDFFLQLANLKLPFDLRISRAQAAVATLQEFKADRLDVFLREGIVNFSGLANFVGKFADFYAGRFISAAHLRSVDTWLQECAPASFGISWSGIRNHSNPSVRRCALKAYALIDIYLDQYQTQVEQNQSDKHRIDDMVGQYLPALISTAVVTQKSAVEFATALANYQSGREDIQWSADFDRDVHFGYWGNSEDPRYLELEDTVKEKYAEDLKSQKFKTLGGISWRDALQVSPAEPGLSRAVKLPMPSSTLAESMYSVGGWADLHPVQALSALGCDRTIYVTRGGAEADLAVGAATLLGADPATDIPALYDLTTDVQSSFETALQMATARGMVWCTEWNKFGAADILKMSEEAYSAIRLSRDKVFRQGVTIDPDSLAAPVLGCTVGVESR